MHYVPIAIVTNYQKLSCLKEHKLTSLQFWRSEVGTGPLGANIQRSARCISPGDFQEDFLCIFQILEAALFSLVHGPFLHLQSPSLHSLIPFR